MHPPRYPPIAPEKPMPSDVRRYDTSYMGEFSNGTIAELPVMPAELESHQQKGSDYPYNTGDMGVGYPDHEQFMGLEHTVPRTLEYTNTTRLPLSLDIQQSFSSVPSLMSGHPSHISSPVSSLDTNIVEDLQLGSHGDFRRKSESFINAHSPSRQSWAGTNGIGMGLNGAWQDDRALLATMNRTQASFASAGGSPSSNPAFRRDSHIEHTSWPHSDGAPICDAGSTSSPSMQRSTGSALPQSRGLESILLGVYEQESEHVWRHSPLDGTERQNVKITNRSTIGLSPSQSPSQASQFDGQQQLETYAEHHDHTYPEVVEEAQCECSQCGKIFHGKYCDTNMRRHIRVIHKCIGRTKCSMCERWFRRSDAARKHEWDRHRLSSAMPKTRANS